MKFLSTHLLLALTKRFLYILIFLTGFASLNNLNSQNTCTYVVEMFDSFGDGWSGNFLTVTSAGVTTTHEILSGAFGTSTFEVVDGQPIILEWTVGSFPTEPSFEIFNPDGILVFSAQGPIQAGEIYNQLGKCPVCESPDLDLIVVNQITDTSARVNWLDVSDVDFYSILYGPQGFPAGTGLEVEVTDSEVILTGLNPCVDYDVYLTVNCGVDSTGSTLGPIQFQTDYFPPPPGDTCTYIFELIDDFGDGWNGSLLTVTHNGNTTEYTVLDGDGATFEFVATGNLAIDFNYAPGGFENEVSYNIIDPNGMVIFSDGPFPAVGDVFSTIACPDCPSPFNPAMTDVNADNATMSWSNPPGADGNYLIEYGPVGFTRGTGVSVTASASQNSVKLTGLEEMTWYNAYISLQCDTLFSKPVGPLTFKTIWKNDVGVTAITDPNPDEICDYSASETITIDMTNFGQAPQTLFEFYFAVNGVPASIPLPDDGLFTGVVGNDSTQNISFETTWDFSEPGIYVIEAWTEMEGDSDIFNDTTSLEIITAFLKPIQEDFEDNSVPETWSFMGNSADIYPPMAHGNDTYVFGTQLFPFNEQSTLTTSRIGVIETGDTLYFDYRFIDAFFPSDSLPLMAGDRLEVQVSTDCGESYETIFTVDDSNHDPTTAFTTIALSLDDFAGELITIRFLGESLVDFYWMDLDNINIPGCSGNLGLVAEVTGSVPMGATGSITVTPNFGIPPYTYSWNNGSTTNTANELASGVYEVVVEDASGCTDVATYDVGIFVNDNEINLSPEITFYPNPTSGMATLELVFPEMTTYQTSIINLSGQVVHQSAPFSARETRQQLDLSNQPDGLYILQVIADGQPYHIKLMVVH